MQCRYCNANLPDGAAFCGVCGNKQEVTDKATCFCLQCGAQLPSGAAFCGNCGARNEHTGVAPVTPKKDHAIKNITLPKLQISRKGMIAGLGAVAAILVILLAAALFSGGSDTGIVYLKDGQLQHILASGKDEAHTLTERLAGKKNMDADDLLDLATDEIYGKVKLSVDGKKLFYPDRFDGDEYTLYCQDLSNTKKDPVKIDSGLSGTYQINDKGTMVTYLKEQKLYQHDLKEKHKIDSGVSHFYVSDDSSMLLYEKAEEKAPAGSGNKTPAKKAEKKRKYDGLSLYLKTEKGDPVELEENIYRYAASDDLSLIYFLIDYDLYMVKNGGEAEKVATDVMDIWLTGKNGCYFTVQKEDTIVSWDLVEDDLQNQESERLQGILEDRSIDNPVSELHHHNGKEDRLLEQQVREFVYGSAENNFLSYTAIAGDTLPTIRLSDYEDYNGSFKNLVTETLDENTKTYVLQDTKSAQLPLENIYRMVADEKAGTLWVMTDYDKKAKEVTLHEVKLSGGTVKSVEEIDDEVYYSAFVTDGKNYVYWRSMKDNAGELCWNGKEIADDAPIYGCRMDKDSGKVFFMTDYSSKNGDYTLACWNGKKVIDVDDDVSMHTALGEGSIAYLTDYSDTRQEGDLYIWTGKEPVKLDEDVLYIIPVSSRK